MASSTTAQPATAVAREHGPMTAPNQPRRSSLPSQPAQAAVLQRLDDDVDLSALAEVLRVDRSTLYRLLGRDRLRFDAADRIAVTLGRHPPELWPEWFTEAPA